jgi:hypothetical protein
MAPGQPYYYGQQPPPMAPDQPYYYEQQPPPMAPGQPYYYGQPQQPVNKPPSALFIVGLLVVIADLIFGMIAAMVLTEICGSIPIILSIVGIIIGAVLMGQDKKQGAIILSMSLIFLIATLFVWFFLLVILKH